MILSDILSQNIRSDASSSSLGCIPHPLVDKISHEDVWKRTLEFKRYDFLDQPYIRTEEHEKKKNEDSFNASSEFIVPVTCLLLISIPPDPWGTVRVFDHAVQNEQYRGLARAFV